FLGLNQLHYTLNVFKEQRKNHLVHFPGNEIDDCSTMLYTPLTTSLFLGLNQLDYTLNVFSNVERTEEKSLSVFYNFSERLQSIVIDSSTASDMNNGAANYGLNLYKDANIFLLVLLSEIKIIEKYGQSFISEVDKKNKIQISSEQNYELLSMNIISMLYV
ncbi:hypothetical protein ACJX0J_038810, partial [Zea mays]